MSDPTTSEVNLSVDDLDAMAEVFAARKMDCKRAVVAMVGGIEMAWRECPKHRGQIEGIIRTLLGRMVGN
jgi:hypothetical protein